MPTAKLTESFNGVDLEDGTSALYSEEALRNAYKDLQVSFAALGVEIDDNFPTIEEFRIAFEEELKINPPEEGDEYFGDEDQGDSKPRRH